MLYTTLIWESMKHGLVLGYHQRPHVTQCVFGPHTRTCQMTCKSVERFKHVARVWQTTDKQTTDHATDKWVAIASRQNRLCQRLRLKCIPSKAAMTTYSS